MQICRESEFQIFGVTELKTINPETMNVSGCQVAESVDSYYKGIRGKMGYTE